MSFEFNLKHLELLRDRPHLIGHLVNKKKLTDLHSKWIIDLWRHPGHKSIQAHRGAYKTTACTEVACIWWLLFNPDDRIAIIRKPYTEAAKTLRTIKDYFKQDTIQALFYYAHGMYPRLEQKKENSLIFNFKGTITKEGSLDAYGVDGNITGNHYDKIICDDFVTLKDRTSRAEREKTKDYIREIITNIIDPGKYCMFIGTPWHKNDAWEIVPQPDTYTNDQTGILSEAEIQEKRDTTTPSLFACNYQLIHMASEDMIFSDPLYERWDYKIGSVYAHLDAKYSGTCTNALTIMASRPDGFIQARGWTDTRHIKEWKPDVIEILRKMHARKLFNEDNADKGFLADEFKADGVKVTTYHEDTNKHIKISAYLKSVWHQIYWDPDTDPEYMEQIIDYAEGQKPDDAPDSAASLIKQAFPKNAKGGMELYKL